MEYIKEAFKKVKKDIDFLYEEINILKEVLNKTNKKLENMNNLIEKNSFFNKNNNFSFSTQKPFNSTNTTNISTDNLPLEGLKSKYLIFSNGNQGVSTDRQTNTQTDKHPFISYEKNENSIENASKMIESLDNLKKQIRLKFKRLTPQEFLVFSTIYQLNEEGVFVNYQTLSHKLSLTESSIRDYVRRLFKKGIPIEKTKINNKSISLSINKNLKKIASLSTILQLREL